MARLLQHTLAAALLAALVCGCSSDDVAGGGASSGDTQVSFILKLSDASGRTRAAWDEGYDSQSGTEYEDRISPDDLKVALYNAADNTFAADVDILSYHETATEGEYEFVGSVEAADGGSLSTGSYKIMVFANCGDIDPSGTTTQLDELAYQYSADNVKAETQLIPMWGVATATLTLEKGARDDAGKIDLLRAFAKVEIGLHRDIAGTTSITSATLTRYNTSGYCLPAGYANVNQTTGLDQEDGTNPSFNPNGTAQSTDLAFTYSEDGKSAYLYIPEYENSTDEAQIDITLSDGTTGTLEFKSYTGGTAGGDAYDIVRNHIYRYTVNVYQGELVVEAAVMPWQLVTSSIGWMPQPASTTENPFADESSYEEFVANGSYILLPRQSYSSSRNSTQKLFSYLYNDPKAGDVEARLNVLYRPSYDDDDNGHQTFKDDWGSAGARFFFMLTGPEGATWEAHLSNTEDFGFSTSSESVFNTSNSEWQSEGNVRMATHGRARTKPYVIQIIALNNYTGTEIGGGVDLSDFADGNHQDWFENDEYLTDWGRDKWYGHKVVDTEFYITVKLTDGTEYELTINPSYNDNNSFDDSDFYYNDRKRYAGTDTRIWIRQIRAQYGGDYVNMAKNVSPTDNEFEWWRVNPYWYGE